METRNKQFESGRLSFHHDNPAPLQWPIGRVHYVYTGPDSAVRVVKVKTPTGIYNRSVHKLKKLPIDI